MKPTIRTIHPEIKVLDESQGLVEYVASDETLDHYREIIRADGWRFDFFTKNSPFLDSHNGETIGCLLGMVVDARIEGKQLIETVKWAIDVPDNKLAALGFKMTAAGYLKAVSVGFFPVRSVSKWDNNGQDLAREATALGLDAATTARVSTIYLEQQQVELSACVIGANPSALARAYKAGCADDADVELVASELSARSAREIISAETKPKTARAAIDDAAAARATEQRQRDEFLRKFQQLIKS